MSAAFNTRSTPAVKSTERIFSIDTFRLIATFLIVITHSNIVELMFLKGMSLPRALMACSILSVLRLGLPFVFVAAGYFLTKKLNSSNNPWNVLFKALPRLLTAYIFWCVIYAFVPWDYADFTSSIEQAGIFKALYWSFLSNVRYYDVIYILFNGTHYHLYFLPTLIISLLVVTSLTSHHKGHLLKYIFWLAYLLPMFFVSYREMEFYHHIKEGFLFGLGYASAYVLCGYFIANQPQIEKKSAKRLIIFGVCCLIVQFWCVAKFLDWNMTNQILIGILPIVLGLFQWGLLNPNIGKNTVLPKLGLMTLGIYCVHPLILGIVHHAGIGVKFWGLDVVTPIFVYTITLALCILLKRIPLTEKLVS